MGKERRVVVKAEILAKGENPRFVVTNIEGEGPEEIYEGYTKRGDIENRIKEFKRDIVCGRTSCHRFLANQLRLILHAAAYVLLSRLRRMLRGSEMGHAQVGTLRTKILKVGARVRETTRRIWISMPSSYPYQQIWRIIQSKLAVSIA